MWTLVVSVFWIEGKKEGMWFNAEALDLAYAIHCMTSAETDRRHGTWVNAFWNGELRVER